jgi:hypothetical protein
VEGGLERCLPVAPRMNRDGVLRPKTERPRHECRGLYGGRKAWPQLRREGDSLARCTVERLGRHVGLLWGRSGPEEADHANPRADLCRSPLPARSLT